ncbi:hypothetical protein H9655_21100 [Cytobacillus sp. Sa5YUA1]|uniref:Uncharacterized protein n=1 Tax=Cytobacillus stercorigallinarum TaxID=2762240 RepID=A0ABR8QVI2_9BACI|nr:hypothetical protein [Cytobacillus stercorigallinarum]MBD7939544.1 hypothetical protein [Cytobacillus stercorigallinarum]
MKRRVFEVNIQRIDNESAIGIIEWGETNEQLFIASLYYDKKLSRSEAFDAWNIAIINELEAGEYTLIRTNDISTRSRRRLKYPRNLMKFVAKGHLMPAKTLAFDALIRKTNIKERF